MTEMRHEFGSLEEPGVLTPALALDIGVRSREQRILAAMAMCCATNSFAATTIADIVGEAQISRATFYKHFANKQECFDAAVASFAMTLEAAAMEAYSSADSPSVALPLAVAAFLELLRANPAFARLLLIEVPVVDSTLLDVPRALLAKGIAAEWGTNGGSDQSSAAVFGSAHVLIAEYIASGRTEELPDLLPELVYVLLLPFAGQSKALAQAEQSR
jgi:AcrR family transcriptional regulator